MSDAMGPAAPRASGPEAETLRRFRSFTGIALHRGEVRPPALDGLQLNERRMGALLGAWLEAACISAGPDSADVRLVLSPLVDQFRGALRVNASGRGARGKPRAARRAVVAAIDRVADGFLAIDTVSDSIVDANPAAGALLGTPRDALLDVEFSAFVPKAEHAGWRARLDAMAEGGDHLRFETTLVSVSNEPIAVEVSVTAYPSRGRTLALCLCRAITAPIEKRPEAETPRAKSTEPAGTFIRLSDGKTIPRRGNGLRRDGGRRSPEDGPRHRPTLPR